MRVNTKIERVYCWEDKELVKSFSLDVGNVTIPVATIQVIIQEHFNYSGDYGFAGFNKINAIKAVRQYFEVRDVNGNSYGTFVGLRDAKEMVEAAYREGTNAGNYHASLPAGQHLTGYEVDPLPF